VLGPVLVLPGLPTALGSVAGLLEPLTPGERLSVVSVSSGTVLIVSGIWFAGFATVMGLVALQSLYLGRLRRGALPLERGELVELTVSIATALGIRHVPRVLVSSKIPTPCVTGLFRPVVLLPRSVVSSLSRDAMAQLLTHELAHLRQRDPWLNWLRAVACAIWWPHPLVWVLARVSRGIREECCDDVVLSELRASPREYARTILTAAASGSRSGLTLLASGVHDGRTADLRSRLLRLGDPTARRARRLSWAQGLIVLIFGALALNGPTVHVPVSTAQAADGTRTIYVHLDGGDADTWAERHARRHRHNHRH